MKNLFDIPPGTSFYFPDDKGTLYKMHHYILRKDGTVKTVAAFTDGKLYAVYMKATHRACVVGEKQTTLTPQS